MANDLLTVTEAARILGTSSDSVRYYERQGRLNAMRIGTHRVFFRQDVERFKREREAEAHAKAEFVHV
jgi:excisionase family DNA binding protein